MPSVDVFLADRFVGVLRHRSEWGDAAEFQLDGAYAADPDRLVLGQIFEADPGRIWRTTHRIPAWFSNLLPEGELRRLLAEGVGVHPERELHLLSELGGDLAGAVTVSRRPGDSLDAAPISQPERLAPVGADEPIRMSLAGLQLKFSVDLDARPVLPVRGQGGRWIAKLPDLRFPQVPENEHAILSWAKDSGLEVPEHRLVPLSEFDGLPHTAVAGRSGNALLVRRFDRGDLGERIHIEDFAQVRNVVGEHAKYNAANYEGIASVLLARCGVQSLREFVSRLVFMLYSGNADMHLKNWSLIYRDGRVPTLSPSYDLVATRAYAGTSQEMALKLAKTRRFEDVERSAFSRMARKLGSDPREILRWVDEAVVAVREAWALHRGDLPADQGRSLERLMSKLRL